ncbi:MAG: thioredoxin domain-containing protein, partial [Anaerolineales bacterium]
MSNALAGETSPYLLQHAENPVAWLPWGEEAFARARREDKPIFLSVGYAACHWCHVMAHESFEDSATAATLNDRFIPVKVDREERPDVDSLYMDAVVALTGQGGWPMSVFLTPEGKPFYGGTYFPPERRHGLPAFRELLQGIDHAWRQDRESLLESASRVAEHVAASSAGPAGGGDLRQGTLDTAAEALWRGYDGVHGGWGGAPKFPAALAVEFLLRRTVRTGDKLARDLVVQTLEAMAAGGIYDQLGGGFHRYAVDAAWRVPHFEKMLYDNALLARVYLQAWLLTGRDRLLEVARGTLDFLLDEMRLPEGGLASSLDADSEGEEGRYYVWTDADFRDAIGDAAMEEIARTAWGVTPEGNFEGRNVLVRAAEEVTLEARFGRSGPGWREKLAEARRRLLVARG